ncbi:MAG TPA: hypothetical protein VFN92_10680 [Solirubrobacterales bacterium]|nr:hypothetical protein [Solirubrobacterales bacterium]
MLSYRGGRRVTVVIRPVDGVFRLLRLLLIPLLIGAWLIPTIGGAAGLGALSKGLPLALAVLAVLVLYGASLRMESVRALVDSIFGRLQRQVVMACQTDAPSNQRGQVKCRLTAEELRAPLLPYQEQRNAVRDLLDACRQEQMGQYWFLEGRSGRGKTRTGMLFVQELVRDLSLVKYGTHTYLYDFGESDSEQDALLHSLGGSQHEQSVVLVDNFHLVREDVLSRLTSRLIEQPSSLSERMLLFLSRRPDAWNLGRGGEVRLVSEAKAANRHLELSGPSSESLARSLALVDKEGSRLIQGLQVEAVASAPQLHLAQVIQRQGGTPAEISTIARLLKGDAPDADSQDLVEVLALIVALSMHSGSFSEAALHRAERALAGGRPGGGRQADSQRRRATLRRLRRIGLVTRSHRRGTHYLFHEASAKLCIDQLSSHSTFEVPFGTVGRSRLRDASADGDSLRAWLIAVEVGAQEEAARHFDAAMAHGPYTRMLRCLERANDRYELSPALHLQLAILLDRTGNFGASQEAFGDDVLLTLDPSSELAMIFIATRLEASHDHTLLPAIDLLCDSPDRVVAIVGEYWKLHFAAHGGHFASRQLLDLGAETLELIRSRESHWLDYSLGRMHFDSLRHFYLEGAAPAEDLASRERREIGEYLRSRLPSYDAFETLYMRAHLVGLVLLPQVAIFFEPVTFEQAAQAEVLPGEVETKNDLVKVAQRLYKRARDQFRQYGDREAEYLQADVLFVEMIEEGAHLDDFQVRLHQYERFIEKTGIEDIASYPHLHFLRWHVLKHYELLPQASPLAARQAEENLTAAHRRLQRVVELDSAAGNEYGLMRAEMLGVLLRWVKGPPAEGELRGLAQRMSERGYMREKRLLDHLAARDPLPILELREVFRFYPFVGQ